MIFRRIFRRVAHHLLHGSRLATALLSLAIAITIWGAVTSATSPERAARQLVADKAAQVCRAASFLTECEGRVVYSAPRGAAIYVVVLMLGRDRDGDPYDQSVIIEVLNGEIVDIK